MAASEFSAQKAVNENAPRVALIGVTGYGLAHFEEINKLVAKGRARWGAATVVNPEVAREQMAFFRERQIPVYGDYREMLDGERGRTDWVCIPTGIGWHTEMTLACLARGLQVLVEKPLAPTLQEVASIQLAEQEAGIQVGVGFQHAYDRQTWEIKRRLVEGEIGELRRVDCIALWPRSRCYYKRNGWGGTLHDGHSWVLDSPLHNGLSHLANLILFWSGSELETRADIVDIQAEAYRSKRIESYDTIRSSVWCDTGVEANVILSHSSSHSIDPEIHLTGTKGELIWRFQGNHCVTSGGKRFAFPTVGQIEVREHMFEALVDHVQGKPARICTTELAKGTVKWVNAVHDTAPIAEVDQEFRQKITSEAGEEFDAISHLEYYALRSLRERKSFAEVGAPWAVEPRRRDLRHYEAFEGRYCPDPLPPLPEAPVSR